jgi:DNA-directed RNA polymerase beta' subunit
MDESTVLQSVQEKLMELWDLIFMQINQKDGHIKDQILGGRINFSARNVIIQDPDLRADEIKLGYLAFLELYKYEIIAHLAKMNDISENEAYDQWYRATINFNQKIYEIMMYLVKKIKPRVVINRNPTINYGSMLAMKVVEVKAEYKDDFTMSLPIQILRVLNADFDGDILNIISLKVKKLIKAYDRTFNPRKNMFISRNDGRFNNDFNLFKDQLIGLYEFNNI